MRHVRQSRCIRHRPIGRIGRIDRSKGIPRLADGERFVQLL
jgi:hypothetical protein